MPVRLTALAAYRAFWELDAVAGLKCFQICSSMFQYSRGSWSATIGS